MCITPKSLLVSFYLGTHVPGATQNENDSTEFFFVLYFFKTRLIHLKVINDHITEHILLRQKKQRNTIYTLYSTVTVLSGNCHTKKNLTTTLGVHQKSLKSQVCVFSSLHHGDILKPLVTCPHELYVIVSLGATLRLPHPRVTSDNREPFWLEQR